MESAKDSVKKFMSKDGKHDTTVHETVAPSIQNETISRKQHEHQTTAVDREVHQDHHHTTEQPISHSEILPETHHHQAAEVEHRSFEHGDSDKLKRGLDDERKKYYDTQTRVEGEKTRSENPTVQGEHVHHHVHETIQPVVHKQTVEPHVVHTTVPIHEVHHNEAHHHSSTALPAMSMDDFKKQGGSLGGREEKSDFFHGEPKSFGQHNVRDEDGYQAGTTNSSGSDNRTKEATTDRIGTDSHTQPSTGSDRYGSTDSDKYGSIGNDKYGSTGSSGKFGTMDGGSRDGRTPTNTSSTSNTTSSSTPAKKPSLMDRINPKVDSNGDGKVGFMK